MTPHFLLCIKPHRGQADKIFVMKKFIISLAVCIMAFASTAFSQNLQEVVYLKNGSIIKGIVVEQVPGISLKLKTYDGSIFVYQMSEIEKIAKEEISSSQYRQRANKISTPNMYQNEIKYKGFVDLGYTFGVGNGRGLDKITFTTSHGAQVLPFLYIGAGAGFNYYYDWASFCVPIFANIRTEISQLPISPFFDFKIGYSILDIQGLYLSPSIGCRFNVTDNCGLNIGLGYVVQKANLYYDGWDFGNINVGGLCLKVGVNF